MAIQSTLLDEIEVLQMFDLSSTQQGIKIHHNARNAVKQAAEKLFKQGLITQRDGGYLTDLGYEAAQHLQHALEIIAD